MRNASILLVLFISVFTVSCGSEKAAPKTAPVVKTGVAPVADPEIAVIEMENAAAFGTIKIELYPNIAPQHVARFKELAKSGFYNGTTFHRVSNIVIQGGDPNSKDADPNNDGMGKSDKPDLPAEFSDVPFERGIIGAARSQDPNSANAQFFITMQRYPGWDRQYTVFGKVIEGMNNAGMIAGVPTDRDNPMKRERPLEDVRIKSITFQTR